MQEPIIVEQNQHVRTLIFNRIEKHNAFDDHFIEVLHKQLHSAAEDQNTHLVVLKARGAHFSAGADLAWMQRMALMTEEENVIDAQKLAELLHTLYHLQKPTISLVQGSAFGGGVGIIAATDIALATTSSRFCFSEVKLGLIPAVISPFVIEAIGARAATALFMSAEVFDAQKALDLKLLHRVIPDEKFEEETSQFIQHLNTLPKEAICLSKMLVRHVKHHAIDSSLQMQTAKMIAHRRVSEEGQRGIQTFLNKSR
jgi:methylglutaconyl-CoA hydratase